MSMTAASVDPEHGATQFDFLSTEIDEDSVDEVIAEMTIDTALPLETQRWLIARGMAAVSLAASVRRDEDYYRALAALGDGPAAGDEQEFAGIFLAKMADDLVETFKGDGEHLTSDLMRRLRDRDVLLGLHAGGSGIRND